MLNSFECEFAKIMDEYNTGGHEMKLRQLLNELKGNPPIIFGAGKLGHCVFRFLSGHGVPVLAFCDTYKTGGGGVDKSTGIQIISPEELQSMYPHAIVIIGTCNCDNRMLYDTIHNKLIQIGFLGRIVSPEELVFPAYFSEWLPHKDLVIDIFKKYGDVWSFLSDDQSREVILNKIRLFLLWESIPHSPYENQYFEPNLIHLGNDEVFIDGGFYTGDTTEEFVNQTNGVFNHIFGFEPDEINISKYVPSFNNDKITVMKLGLWSDEEVLRFQSADMGSTIQSSGEKKIAVTSLDNFFMNMPEVPTFIKLDVEGSELQVILGARNLLKNHKPKLAVCAYHKLDDIYTLLQNIKAINSEYKFYYRHYNSFYTETILYAV